MVLSLNLNGGKVSCFLLGYLGVFWFVGFGGLLAEEEAKYQPLCCLGFFLKIKSKQKEF